MGNEGGSVPRRADVVRVRAVAAAAPGVTHTAAARIRTTRLSRFRWRRCALTVHVLALTRTLNPTARSILTAIAPPQPSSTLNPPLTASPRGFLIDPETALSLLLATRRLRKVTSDKDDAASATKAINTALHRVGIHSRTDIINLHPQLVSNDGGNNGLWNDVNLLPSCVLSGTILGTPHQNATSLASIDPNTNVDAQNDNGEDNDNEPIPELGLSIREFTRVFPGVSDPHATFVTIPDCGCVMLRSALIDVSRTQKAAALSTTNSTILACPACNKPIDTKNGAITTIDDAIVVLAPLFAADVAHNDQRITAIAKLAQPVTPNNSQQLRGSTKRSRIPGSTSNESCKSIKKSRLIQTISDVTTPEVETNDTQKHNK